jgi:hypothetical protein
MPIGSMMRVAYGQKGCLPHASVFSIDVRFGFLFVYFLLEGKNVNEVLITLAHLTTKVGISLASEQF